jgi:hypothetical protein
MQTCVLVQDQSTFAARSVLRCRTVLRYVFCIHTQITCSYALSCGVHCTNMMGCAKRCLQAVPISVHQ